MGSMGWTTYSVVDPDITQVKDIKLISNLFYFLSKGAGRGDCAPGGKSASTVGEHNNDQVLRPRSLWCAGPHCLHRSDGDWEAQGGLWGLTTANILQY